MLAASSIFPFIPSYVLGYTLQETFNYKIMSYSIVFSLFCMLFCPFLALYGAVTLNDFFLGIKSKFKDKEKWEDTYFTTFDSIFSSKYYFISLPWIIAIPSIITFVYFRDSPILVKLWSFIIFFYLSLISSRAFHALNEAVKMFSKIFSSNILKFDAYHLDNFGGFLSTERYVLKMTLLLSVGTLLIPLAFDVCYKCKNQIYIDSTIILVIIYIFMLGYCYFTPLLAIKNFVITEKESLIHESRDQLNKMICDIKDDDDEKKCLANSMKILIHYQIMHSKLEQIKDNPWDLKSLLQFFFSVLIPSVVTIIKLSKGS